MCVNESLSDSVSTYAIYICIQAMYSVHVRCSNRICERKWKYGKCLWQIKGKTVPYTVSAMTFLKLKAMTDTGSSRKTE